MSCTIRRELLKRKLNYLCCEEITMPSVYNWQIGRQMSYPYEQATPKEQFAFVININRCIGCQTCTMACKSTSYLQCHV